MKAGLLTLERLALWMLVAGLMARNGGPLTEVWKYLSVAAFLAVLFGVGVLFLELLGRAMEWAHRQWFHVK